VPDSSSSEHKPDSAPVDIGVAGWFLLAAGIWELLFNRLASALGIYSKAGAEGFLGILATSGRFAMNTTGIMALCLSCAILPRLASNPQFASLSFRVVLMLTSPLYLPLICMAVFHPIDPLYVFLGYLITTAVAVMLAILTSTHRINGNARRLIFVLGLIEFLAAFELVCRFIVSFQPLGSWEIVPKRAYLLAEALFVAVPFFAFFALRPGRFASFVRRPHALGLLLAAAALAVAVAAVVEIKSGSVLSLIAYRVLGVTLSVPGKAPIYVASLFLGTLLVGSLVLPSKRWPLDARSRRIGIGLGCIWIAGIQPTHPYQFILMLTGFLYLARGFLDGVLQETDTRAAAFSAPVQPETPPDGGSAGF
jgi:hypothetical protein